MKLFGSNDKLPADGNDDDRDSSSEIYPGDEAHPQNHQLRRETESAITINSQKTTVTKPKLAASLFAMTEPTNSVAVIPGSVNDSHVPGSILPSLTTPLTPILSYAIPAVIPANPIPVPAINCVDTNTLYGIPPASAVKPIHPVLPAVLPPKPAYPKFDIPEGAKVVENPYRVLIGPLSVITYVEWTLDNGKNYIRSKVDRSVFLCHLVKDTAGRGYVIAFFDSQEGASKAMEIFRAYPW